jgi:hypothetical protein
LVLLSTRGVSGEAEVCGRCSTSPGQKTEKFRKAAPAALNPDIASPLRGTQLAREAALLVFCDPVPEQCLRLQDLSSREWLRLLHWLDISGLALYFFDRMIELHLCDWLPDPILNRLWWNLIANGKRTNGMLAESSAIQQDFQKARLSYAVLKGISFWPIAVPKPELRSQFDLDFLVAEENAPAARTILERRGYRLYAMSGRSWEFKRNEKPGLSLKDLYIDTPSRTVEVHVASRSADRAFILDRVEWREVHGMNMPVLGPVDLCLGHGLHVYKHLCNEFSRAAHLLEFRRHVLARRADEAFWNELRSRASENPRASLGLGVVTLLITLVMGDFAPEALTGWTVNQLPRPARLWVETYGRRAAFDDFPGSKLYLLLQRELQSVGSPAARTRQKALFPLRFPPAVIKAFPNEALPVRLARYRMQLEFVLTRLRFHFVEGLRYTWESHRWKRERDRLTR